MLGDEHPDTLNSLDTLAGLYRRQGKYDESEKLLGRVAELRRRVMGAQHRDTIATLASLGRVRILQQKFAEAELPLREALGTYESTASDNWRRFHTQSLMGASLAGQGRPEEAEPLLVGGYRGLLQRKGSIPEDSLSDLAQSGEWVVRLYQDWGKLQQAAEWRQTLRSELPTASPVK